MGRSIAHTLFSQLPDKALGLGGDATTEESEDWSSGGKKKKIMGLQMGFSRISLDFLRFGGAAALSLFARSCSAKPGRDPNLLGNRLRKAIILYSSCQYYLRLIFRQLLVLLLLSFSTTTSH